MTQQTSGSPTQSTIPRLATPFVTLPDGNITEPWHRVIIDLWKKLGSGAAVTPQAVYFQLNPNTNLVEVYAAYNNELLGILQLSGGGALPPVPQNPVVSPFVFNATTQGTLVVDSGKVELQRQSTGWYTVGVTGGAIAVLAQDQVRVTWFQAPPHITFFPTF